MFIKTCLASLTSFFFFDLEPRADGTGYISLLDSYTNLAPIRDMTVMRCNGQQQILTCSGAYKVSLFVSIPYFQINMLTY